MIACPNCGHGTCNDGINGDGQCICDIEWTSSDGGTCNSCAAGYYSNGGDCLVCGANEYSFNETTCLSCPQNSSRMSKWKSILDCNCTSFNHYPNNQTSTCLPCDYGFLLDDDSNTCQSNILH